MISFYPGPSKIYPEVGAFMQEAATSGILSVNHRSKDFVALSEKTIKLLKSKLLIPEDYSVFFTSSATECWEIIAQSLIKEKSLHLYNGAFGEKWFEYTQKLKPLVRPVPFGLEKSPEVFRADEDIELIGMVQNETSNGTQISNSIIRSFREQNPSCLIAADATSSMAGIHLEFEAADVWLASVQKCFGLPAGLGLLICSPKAIQRALEINETNHYNSLTFLIDKMKVWQTSYTPNVLGIFLLSRILENIPSIIETDKLIRERATGWNHFLSSFSHLRPLIQAEDIRSSTVMVVQANEQETERIKKLALNEGILPGNGYGTWAKNTFRIANFPAISEQDIKLFQQFLQKNIS